MSSKIKDILVSVINFLGILYFINARATVSGRLKEAAVDVKLRNNLQEVDGLMRGISIASEQIDVCLIFFVILASVYYFKNENLKFRYVMLGANLLLLMIYFILPRIS